MARPGYWKYDWHPISFTLVLENFSVKYIGKEHADHLLSVLCHHYEVNKDKKAVSTVE